MREERGGIQRGMRATLARVESSVLHALPGPLRKAADLLLATRRGRLEAKAQAVEDERVRLEKEANPNPNPNPNPTATPTPIPTPNPNPTPNPDQVRLEKEAKRQSKSLMRQKTTKYGMLNAWEARYLVITPSLPSTACSTPGKHVT